MRKLTKRVLAVLLSLAMVIGMGLPKPIQAKAADIGGTHIIVKDDSDKPLNDATVTAVNTADSEDSVSFTHTDEDSDGYYYNHSKATLDEAGYTITAQADGYEKNSTTIAGSATEATITLAKILNYSIDPTSVTSVLVEKYGENIKSLIKYVISVDGIVVKELTPTSDPAAYAGTGTKGNEISVKLDSSLGLSEVSKTASLTEDNQSIALSAASDELSINSAKIAAIFNPSINKESADITIGETDTLSITVPNDSGWKGLKYSFVSADPTIVSTTDNNNQTTLTALKAGTTTVTATVSIGSETIKTFTVSITVKKIEKTTTINYSTNPEQSAKPDWKTPITFSFTVSDGRAADLSLKINGTAIAKEALVLDGDNKVSYTYQPDKKATISVEASVPEKVNDTTIYSTASVSFDYNVEKAAQSIVVPEDWEENTDGIYVKESFAATYGDTDKEIVTVSVEGKLPASSTGYEAKLVDETQKSEISIDDTGKIKITIKDVGKIRFTVKKLEDDNYNESDPVVFEIDAAKYVVQRNDVAFTVADQTYNGDKDVNATLTWEKALPFSDSEQVTIITAQAPNKDAGSYTEVYVTLDFGSVADFYDISYLNSGEAYTVATADPSYVISNATLTVTVSKDAQAAWTEVRGKTDASQITWIKAPSLSYSGFIAGEGDEETGLTASDITFVAPVIKIEATIAAEVKQGLHSGAVIAEGASASKNYDIVYVNGDLELVDEAISDANEYIRIDQGQSNPTNVYQNDAKVIFYSEKSPKAFFEILNSDYTKVMIDGNDVSGSVGYALDGTLPTQNVSMYLANADETHKTEEFTLTFIQDKTAPNVTIQINAVDSIVKNFTKAITFNLFDNLFTGTDAVKELKAVVTVNDVTGDSYSDMHNIKNWSYVIVNTDKDAEFASEEITETNVNDMFSGLTWTPVPYGTTEISEFIGKITVTEGENTVEKVQAGNYIVFVLATDNVNNTCLYSSQGTIIDDIDMTSIGIAYDGMTAKNKADFFNEDVKLEITVTENTSGVYSGVATLDETVTQDGVSTNKNLIAANETLDDTLENIKNKYGVMTVSTSVAAGEGSKNVTVSYTAADYAGNEISAFKSFVVDPKAPEMEMELSSAASRLNGKYYQNDVTLTTTITERYLDLDNDLVFTISVDGTETTKTYGELAEGLLGITAKSTEKQTDESSDDQQTVVVLTFGEEHDYIVSANVQDKAGNTAEAKADEFVVDKTAPVLAVNYYAYGDGTLFAAGTSEADRTYLNAEYNSFAAIIAVNELNFSDGKTVNANYTVKAVNAKGTAVADVDTASYDTKAKDYASWDNKDGDPKRLTALYPTDANYTFAFDYTDLAGNKAVLDTNYITLDKVVPAGTVTVSNMVNGDATKTWDKLLSSITFGLFGQNSVTASMTSDDEIAGVASTQYITTSELLSKSALAARTDWKDYSASIVLAANENVIIYEKVTDKAGNVEFYSSENIVVDNVDPAPEVTITPSVPAWNKGVYAATDNPGFDIVVTDPISNGAYSGLQTITYTITAEDVTETGELASFTKGSHEQTWTGHVAIDPAKFYSNNVQVTVTASDYSTNEATSETKTLKIDNKAPIVTFSFDTSDAQNGKYYNKAKTLTITVDERNFDPSYEPTVTSTAGGGYSFSGWSTNGEITTGTVTFTGDSDYTVTFECYDLAGNKSNTENLPEFTVDMTTPVITVSYDNNNASNGNYYRAERTATITIVEHNFNSGNVTTTITASLDGEAIDVPVVSEWADNGDTHTATVHYPGDGDYTFDITYTDQAGNAAGTYAGDSFTVDKTNPTLEISGVADKSANNGTVAPVISVSDINFDSDNVTYKLTGVNTGEVDTTDLLTVNVTEQGMTVTFKNFPEGMDDIYTLTAKAVDDAGNETTKTITFSVNRDGSTYIINDSTKKLLDKGFTNNPQDIVIKEINVDTLEFVELSYTKDGQVVKLEEGKDYTVEVTGGDGEWKEYTYTIKASAFSEEGSYSINIYSEDTAKNSSTNQVKEMVVEFIVDKTAPTMGVANLEDNGRYQEESHDYILTVKDNSVIDKVEIYLDGQLWKTIEGDEVVIQNGELALSLAEAGQYQEVQFIAYDAAGNATEPLTYRVLVTSNGWIQFYNNKPLFGGSIAGVVVVGGGLAALIAKRKKKEEDK